MLFASIFPTPEGKLMNKIKKAGSKLYLRILGKKDKQPEPEISTRPERPELGKPQREPEPGKPSREPELGKPDIPESQKGKPENVRTPQQPHHPRPGRPMTPQTP